jgi:23S rRNA (cytosine1962-C5)-methyltransferase
MRELEGLERGVADRVRHGSRYVDVPEGGVNFHVPLAAGQKTGWYFDQSANRRSSRVTPPARACSTSLAMPARSALQAKRAGAAAVTCVDSSKGALEPPSATADANRPRGRAA